MVELNNYIDDKSSYDQVTDNTGKSYIKSMIHVEVILKKINFEFKDSYLIIIQNINDVINNQNHRMQSHYQEALTATISHEQLTPLNSIINFSKYLFEKFQLHILESHQVINKAHGSNITS